MKRELVARFVPLAIIFLVLVFLMPKNSKFPYDYRKGREWKYETLFAQFDFPIYKTDEQIREERDNASGAMIPYYKYSEETSARVISSIERLQLGGLRNAVVYEYFYDRWVPVSELQDLMPLPDNDLASFLDKNRHVERKDTAYYYFLHVTELLMPGAQEPYDFARPQVENLVRNAGQVEFLKQVKSDLYRRAEQRQMVKYY